MSSGDASGEEDASLCVFFYLLAEANLLLVLLSRALARRSRGPIILKRCELAAHDELSRAGPASGARGGASGEYLES